MVNIIVEFVIALIVCGFLFWVVELIIPHLPMPGEFKVFISLLVKVAIVGVVIFYFLIPLLHMLPNAIHL